MIFWVFFPINFDSFLQSLNTDLYFFALFCYKNKTAVGVFFLFILELLSSLHGEKY